MEPRKFAQIPTYVRLPSNYSELPCVVQIISADTIIHFTEDMDAVMFVLTVVSSLLQLYVILAALKHIRRKTSDKVDSTIFLLLPPKNTYFSVHARLLVEYDCGRLPAHRYVLQ